MKKLTPEEIKNKLQTLRGWTLEGESIKKEWVFQDFAAAMKFLNTVAGLAEKYNHHPEMCNVFNRVSIRYHTHEAGGLTELDFLLAREIDRIEG